ncbi:MAG: hypothetical protein QNJ07_12100 [Woeseiaceae bacterium]|nr:hypothetical protein [Woeseiaceae bacterium]
MTTRDFSAFSLDAFERGTIDAAEFDHEAHIYVAWSYMNRYPVTAAIERFSGALKSLTRQLGVPEKYHETITWFYLLLIAERRGENEDWGAFRRHNNDLFDRSANVLTRYYRPATLQSDRARQSFVLPDAVAA